MPLTIRDGAIFIADAHENEARRFFWQFLCEIENKNVSQLFLMGDIFDLFIGNIDASENFALPYVKKLEDLAKKCEIYYFEGNHDFNLAKYFQNVKVFDIYCQPVLFQTPFGNALISHGDCFGDVFYRFYTAIIRNKITLKILNFLNNILFFAISRSILQSQKRKKLYHKIKNFQDIICRKIPKYKAFDVKFIFEGHYHQNQKFTHENIIYQNFSSFACDKSYFVVQFDQSMKITETKIKG